MLLVRFFDLLNQGSELLRSPDQVLNLIGCETNLLSRTVMIYGGTGISCTSVPIQKRLHD